MSRNLKRDYLKKLAGISTTNGYKIDLANYIYNPSYEHEYPTLTKVIEETETERTYKIVEYFKYYCGTGEYIVKTYTAPTDKNNTWYVVKDKTEQVIEESNRFNLNKLIAIAEAN